MRAAYRYYQANHLQYNNRITPPLDEGDIIFFPSTLEHYVTGNKTNNHRATISANFILELKQDEEK
jgi:ectoine hydroxylase-related dioxygenase (phytanoyl-CoA dioxygenase family)